MYNREEIESLPARERPLVRCEIDRINIDSEDRRHPAGSRSFNATITCDGHKAWLVAFVAGKQIAFWVSWGLLLEVLNDRFARPINFLGQYAEYEV